MLRLQRHLATVIMYPFLQWKCKLSLDFPISVEAILYDEDERLKLFAYFLQGGNNQVLDNAHGNVFFGVANGTACTMHSLAWNDPEDKKRCSQRNKNINTRSGD
jgi:hypothetical protein